MPPIVIILLMAGFLVVGIFSYYKEKKRKEAVRAWARAGGFHVVPSNSMSLGMAYSGIKLFSKGHSHDEKNIFRGDFHGHGVLLADYRYVTGSGKNRTTHKNGVVILTCDFPTIPLLIRRENVLDKVGGVFGGGDINFESSAFSDKFFVKSSDKKWAYDIVHAGCIDYLLGAPGFNVEFGFKEIAVYKSGYFDGPGYEQAMKMAVKMRELIPGYVIDQMKGSPS